MTSSCHTGVAWNRLSVRDPHIISFLWCCLLSSFLLGCFLTLRNVSSDSKVSYTRCEQSVIWHVFYGAHNRQSILYGNTEKRGSLWCQFCSHSWHHRLPHYNDVIMSAMASQITGVSIVCSTVYSGADQRKHQSSTSLAFVKSTVHRWIPLTKGQ